MADIEFTDNSATVKAVLDDAAIAFLYEMGGEIKSQVARNTRVGKGDLKNSWKYVVDESDGTCTIGSPLQNAIWEEFGTGSFAVKGDGRKGYWVYVKDRSNGENYKPSTNQKQYTLFEAKQVVAFLRSQDLDAYYTKGKTPNRALQKAFESSKGLIAKRAEKVLKARLK